MNQLNLKSFPKMSKLIPIFLSFIFFSTLSNSSMAQSFTPEQVVQTNLDYYNKRDIEGFMASFSEEITYYNFDDHEVTSKGLDQVRVRYTDLFNRSPNLHSTILKRIVFGNKVIDHESIVGRLGSSEVLELVLIYEVKNEKIFKITVMRK
jgi:hypothetical protein